MRDPGLVKLSSLGIHKEQVVPLVPLVDTGGEAHEEGGVEGVRLAGTGPGHYTHEVPDVEPHLYGIPLGEHCLWK